MPPHARNLGLGLCRSEIIGFPDRGGIYSPGLLAVVAKAFAGALGLDLLSVTAAGLSAGLGSGCWHRVPSLISLANVWTTAISCTLLPRHTPLDRIGGFVERLGLGAVYGAAEEIDLAARAIDSGTRREYAPRLRWCAPTSV